MTLLLSVLALLLAAPAAPPAAPSMEKATQQAQIPNAPAAVPPKGDPKPGIHAGTKGATNVKWTFPDAPHDGFDAVRITISPRVATSSPKNYIYWAYDSVFMNNVTWYLGLQPAGEFGKTALFSVFGHDTSSTSPACKSGADAGAGTSCHIHYEWQAGNIYEFTVMLVAADDAHDTWEGSLLDLSTGERTLIGAVTVLATRGYLKPWGANFAEYFKHIDTCDQQPWSEVLFYQAVGYRAGVEHKGKIYELNSNNSCYPVFYTNPASEFVYVQEGAVGKPDASAKP